MYFSKYKSTGNLNHAGTGRTVMTTFDNRKIITGYGAGEDAECGGDLQKRVERADV